MCASYFVPMPASPPRASAPDASVRRETPRAALGTRNYQNQRSRGRTRAGAALSHKGAPRPTTEQSEPRRSAACASGSRHGPRRQQRRPGGPQGHHGGQTSRVQRRAGPPRRQVELLRGAAEARGLRGRATPASSLNLTPSTRLVAMRRGPIMRPFGPSRQHTGQVRPKTGRPPGEERQAQQKSDGLRS